MTDIIWGNAIKIISDSIFELNVTHKKNGNKNEYSDREIIKLIDVDIPGITTIDDSSFQKLNEVLLNQFVKCEVTSRNQDNSLNSKVSHSGVGGY